MNEVGATKKSSSLSNTSTETTATSEQNQPLLGEKVDEGNHIHDNPAQDHANRALLNLSSTIGKHMGTPRNRYPMNFDAEKQHAAANPAAPSMAADRCCCGCMRITTAAYLIAFVELIFIAYHLFLAIWSYDKQQEDYAFSFILGIFCMGLALVAIILMLVGIRKKSAYFLVPHLLMQFALIVSWTVCAGYLMLLMIGGTSIKFNAIIYEDSPKGRSGLANIDRYDPVQADVHARGLNMIFVGLLGLTVVIIAVLIWFFTIIRRCFLLLRQKAADKPTLGGAAQNDNRV